MKFIKEYGKIIVVIAMSAPLIYRSIIDIRRGDYGIVIHLGVYFLIIFLFLRGLELKHWLYINKMKKKFPKTWEFEIELAKIVKNIHN